jgi:hypothetical protein
MRTDEKRSMSPFREPDPAGYTVRTVMIPSLGRTSVNVTLANRPAAVSGTFRFVPFTPSLHPFFPA